MAFAIFAAVQPDARENNRFRRQIHEPDRGDRTSNGDHFQAVTTVITALMPKLLRAFDLEQPSSGVPGELRAGDGTDDLLACSAAFGDTEP